MRDECDGHWIDVVAHMHYVNSGDVYGTAEPIETPWHFHAALDHGVKQITRAQLIGYDIRRDLVHLTTYIDSKGRLMDGSGTPYGTFTSGSSSQSAAVVFPAIINKDQEDLETLHKQDPYLILRIPELGESVVSNDKYTNGAFAALSTLDARPFIWKHDVQAYGAYDNKLALGMLFQDYTRHSTCSDPLVSKEINATNSTVRNLTIQINRLNGEPCTDAKSVTLWLRLFVTRG